MGASHSVDSKTVTLYYVPWRNADVWQSFAGVVERMKDRDITFRMVNAMLDPDEAREAGVKAFPCIVCAQPGTRVAYIENPDVGFSGMMRWINS